MTEGNKMNPDIYAPPVTPEPGPSRGQLGTILFFVAYLLLSSFNAAIGLVTGNVEAKMKNRTELSADSQASANAAWRRGYLTGTVLSNFLFPVIVGSLFLIGKRYRNLRSFAKICMITSIVLVLSSLATLGSKLGTARAINQGKELNTEKAKPFQMERTQNP